MDVCYSIINYLFRGLRIWKPAPNVFPKVVISKIVTKNSYDSEASQNNKPDKRKPCENNFLVNLQTGETIFQNDAFEKIVWVPASANIWFF